VVFESDICSVKKGRGKRAQPTTGNVLGSEVSSRIRVSRRGFRGFGCENIEPAVFFTRRVKFCSGRHGRGLWVMYAN